MTWLPWLIVAVELVLASLQQDENQLLRNCLLLTFFCAMQLLAGHAQTTWYSLLFIAAWVVFRGLSTANWKTTFQALGLLVGCVVIAALVSAVQLLPTAEYLLQSQRVSEVGYAAATTYSFWPWRFLTLLNPNFFGNPGDGTFWGYGNYWEDAVYVGLLPLFLAVSTLPLMKKISNAKEKGGRALVIFLWSVILVAFVLALGKNLPVFPFLYRYVPTFNMFQAPSRMLVWVEISLAILAGIGAAHWNKPVGKSLASLKRYMVGALAIALGAASAWFLLKELNTTLIVSVAVIGFMAFICCLLSLVMPSGSDEIQLRRWQWAVIVFIGLDLGITGWRLAPTINASFYQAVNSQIQTAATDSRMYLDAQDEYALKYQRFFRFDNFNPLEDWSNLRQIMLPNLNLLGDTYSANNFDPLLPNRYAQWMEQVDSAGQDQKIAWLQLMGVGAWEQMDIQSVTGVDITLIPDASRFHWSSCVIEVSDDADALRKVQSLIDSATDETPVSTIVIEKNGAGTATPCNAKSDYTVDQVSDTSNKLSLTLTTGQNGWLMISDSWYPGWTASIDETLTTVEKADYAFRAVYVPAGKHEIVFSYRPASFYIGAGVSITALAVLLLFVLSRVVRLLGKRLPSLFYALLAKN
jgi:heme/copper-type cytochrome/quinol oxidase subunit 4